MKSAALIAQKNEITEYFIYRRLAKNTKNSENKKILKAIAEQEKNHYEMWKKITKQNVRPSYAKIWFYYFLTKIFGLNFGLKIMEDGEHLTGASYEKLKNEHPDLAQMIKEEQEHEEQLINLIDSHVLSYASSIILGLNDALVELTSALAGFTLALQNTHLIASVGFITGISASLSMAASSFLASRENKDTNPLKAGLTTGISYFGTVILLIAPYFIFSSPFSALATSLTFAILIIFLFNFYTSVCQKTSFRRKFFEMVFISLGCAAFNFGLGYLIKKYLNV